MEVKRLSLQSVTKNFQFTHILQEGGDYVTKDISKVLKTSHKLAEGLKLNYGEAYPPLCKQRNLPSRSYWRSRSSQVTEAYLSEIISARIKHILEQIKQELDRRRLLELPGGIVLIGGNAILPGMVELAQKSLTSVSSFMFQIKLVSVIQPLRM